MQRVAYLMIGYLELISHKTLLDFLAEVYVTAAPSFIINSDNIQLRYRTVTYSAGVI